MDSKEDAIKNFIMEKAIEKCLQFGLPKEDVIPQMSLTGSGLYDSMGFLELITDVENKFDVVVDFSEYEPITFDTINGFAKCAVSN